MAEIQVNPMAAADAAKLPGAGLQNFNLQRFGQEVAGEIGIDPSNLGAYGLTEERIREYEARLHSGTQNGGTSR